MKIDVDRVDTEDRAEVVEVLRQLHRAGRRECAIALCGRLPSVFYTDLLPSPLWRLEVKLREHGYVFEMIHFVITKSRRDVPAVGTIQELITLCSYAEGLTSDYHEGAVAGGCTVVGGSWWAIKGYQRGWTFRSRPEMPEISKGLDVLGVFNDDFCGEVRSKLISRECEAGAEGVDPETAKRWGIRQSQRGQRVDGEV